MTLLAWFGFRAEALRPDKVTLCPKGESTKHDNDEERLEGNQELGKDDSVGVKLRHSS